MPVDIDALKAANPMPVVIERLTSQQIVKNKIICPFHEDRSPSLHIYEDGGWHCFGCGAHGGDVIDFVGYFLFGSAYDPSVHFTEVVDRLGGLDIKPLPRHTVKPQPKPKRPISLDTIKHWHASMPQERRDYWYSRGLMDPAIDQYLLGWDGKRYTIPAIYRNVPFGVKRRQSEIDDGLEPKYVMVNGSRASVFNADVLWTTDTVTICEGEIDCMLLNQYGYPAVSSTAGAGTWKPKWAQLFSHVQRIAILYDNDEAGRNGAALVRSMLRRARIVTLPDGIKDVGELIEHYDWPLGWLEENLGE